MEKVKTHFGEVAKEFESIMRRLIPYYEQTPDTDKHSFYKKIGSLNPGGVFYKADNVKGVDPNQLDLYIKNNAYSC